MHTSTFEGRFDLLSAKGTEICFSPSPTPKHILPPACSYVSPASPTVVTDATSQLWIHILLHPCWVHKKFQFQIFMPISFVGRIGDFGNQTLHTSLKKSTAPQDNLKSNSSDNPVFARQATAQLHFTSYCLLVQLTMTLY